MTLRKFLLIPLALSLLLLALYSPEIIKTAQTVFSSVQVDDLLAALLILALGFQLVGHYIRSKKATVLLDPIEKSKISTQLRAFSLGQLFNNILPLRIGELIRAAILSQKLNISYFYTFALIVFERALDVLVITAAAAVFILLVIGVIPTAVLWLLGSLFVIALLGLTVLLFLRKPPKWLLRAVYFVSKQFNGDLKNLIRFKLWSLTYGLNKSLTPAVMKRYIPLTLAMWASYLISTMLVAVAILQNLDFVGAIAASFGPYIGIASPAGPAGLGVFSASSNTFVGNFLASDLTTFNIIAWLVILVPVSLIGVLSMVKTAEPLWKRRSRGASNASLANKIIRNEDVSGELEHFLESYYKGNELSQIVNRLETEGDFSLVKYFRGGSDAITILTLKNKQRTVKKIIPIELKDRLKAQYDWLVQYGKGSIVSVSNENTAEDYYSIDIAYDDSSVPLFEYVHQIPLQDAKQLFRSSWASLNEAVYPSGRQWTVDGDALTGYIDKHIFGCVDKAAETDPLIHQATKQPRIMVNGVSYDNLYQIIEKIKMHPQAWADISSYNSTGVVHGDMITDNILFSRNKQEVIVIDPAPDGNIVNGPVFDFGKAAQSLYCGYEFLLRDEDLVELKDNEISFSENKSLRFSELDKFMREELALEYLSEGERKAILFHAGSLFVRRLKHQVHYTPENALKFYAVGVRTLNHFLDQYS